MSSLLGKQFAADASSGAAVRPAPTPLREQAAGCRLPASVQRRAQGPVQAPAEGQGPRPGRARANAPLPPSPRAARRGRALGRRKAARFRGGAAGARGLAVRLAMGEAGPGPGPGPGPREAPEPEEDEAEAAAAAPGGGRGGRAGPRGGIRVLKVRRGPGPGPFGESSAPRLGRCPPRPWRDGWAGPGSSPARVRVGPSVRPGPARPVPVGLPPADCERSRGGLPERRGGSPGPGRHPGPSSAPAACVEGPPGRTGERRPSREEGN